jgi:hypothetical protein
MSDAHQYEPEARVGKHVTVASSLLLRCGRGVQSREQAQHRSEDQA